MAITKIWAVRKHLNRLLQYVSNTEKTNGPKTDQMELSTIQSVIGYAGENYKTEQRMFVSGLNVSVENAGEQMVSTTSRARKPSDITAWHAVQSFAPGEVTPEQCHEIGVKLAEQLWGDRFDVIVATHLDREHLHNHFVVNAVSFLDGSRFLASKATYREMQRVNDALCREYGLSIIRNPKLDRTLSYDEWKADKDGKETVRNRIRRDFDEAIQKSFTMDGFFSYLKAKGYQFQLIGKYPRVKAPFSERYLRLYKMGDRYELTAIEERIREPKTETQADFVHAKMHGKTVTARNFPVRGHRISVKAKRPVYVIFPGIRAFYYRTLYQVGILPTGRKGRRFRMSRQERELTGRVDRMCEELRLLSKYRISKPEELSSLENALSQKAERLPYSEQQDVERELRILRRAKRRIREREKQRKEQREHGN